MSSSRWSTRRVAAAAVAAPPVSQPARPPAVGASVDLVSQRAATSGAISGRAALVPTSSSSAVATGLPLLPIDTVSLTLASVGLGAECGAGADASAARNETIHGSISLLPVRSSASPSA
eukprot:scaffold291575_cov30-Tisochrysis_lutea.AAC.1